MAFNYEGAKAEGYTDDEIADHLSKKHKFNIDGARQEGYSSSEIIQHLMKKDSGLNWAGAGKTVQAVASGYPVAETAMNLITGATAMPIAGIAGLGAGTANLFGADTNPAEVVGDVSKALTYQPKTDLGQHLTNATMYPLEKLAEGGRYLGEKAQDAGASPGVATAIETGVVGALPLALPGIGRRAHKGLENRWEQAAKEQIEQNRKIEAASEQAVPEKYVKESPTQADQAHASILEPEIRAPQYGRGELPRYPELERDMFGETTMRPEPIARADGLIPEEFKASPRPPELTPEQVKAAQEGRPYVPYEASDPRMGMEATTTRGASPEPLQEVPTIPFEKEPITRSQEPFAGTTGWQYADPRVAEAIANDSILKGMNTRLAKMEKNLEDIGEMQGEVHQRYGDRRIRGGSGQQIGRELVAYTKSMEAVKRDINKLKEAIDKRVKAHEERVRKSPKYEKTLDPFKKGPAGPKGPGRRQGGMINPEVFREGFEKIKELVGGRKLVAYATRDEYGPVFRVSAREANGSEVGSADFIPTRGGLKRLKDRDLISALTEVDPAAQRQGIATEMYKFAHELGNDVIPSTAQTLEGKAMWEGFNRKGVPLRQRGAIDPDLLTLGLSKLINKSKKSEPKVELPDPNKRQSILETASADVPEFQEFWKKTGPELKDLPDNLWSKSIEYFSNAQVLYHDSKNPMVKWLADYVANEHAISNLKSEYSTHGIQFNSKGFLPKKTVNPNSPFSHWSGLTPKERGLVTDIINKYSGDVEPSPDAMRAMGANQKVINALEVLQKPIKMALDDINKQLVANGRKPIQERPFYFMRNAGQGNWLIRVREQVGVDKRGAPVYETIGFSRAQFKAQADGISAKLKERFQNDQNMGKLETIVEAADPRNRGNKYNISTSLLEDIYQALERNDPRRSAINSAIADIKSKGGFGSHRAFRKGVGGMENTPKEFWKTYEKYVGDAHNYESGLRLANLRNQIEFTRDMPQNLKQWALGYIDRARGGEPGEVIKAIENGVDRVFSTITGGQTAPGFARNLVRFSNKMFMSQALFFWKAPFLAAQALQSTTFAPAIMSLYKNHGHTGSVMKSMAYGAVEMFNKSPEFVKVLDFMSARGKIDMNLVHESSALDYIVGRAQSKAGAMARHAFDIAIGKQAASKLESVNRVHAAAVGYHFLKDSMSGKELHLGIERFVDDVMGNYGGTDKPGFVTRHGIIGEAGAPLSTFANWYKGMSAVMLKELLQGVAKGDVKKAVPYVSMWLSSALMAGVLAAPMFKEIDAIWDAVKGIFGFNPKEASISEAVLTSGLPDTGKFGALTGATTFVDPRGIHLTGSMSAPEAMPGWVKPDGSINWKNLAPGLSWTAEGTISLAKLALDIADLKKMTIEERRAALKAISPSTLDAYLSNLDSTFELTSSSNFGFGDRPVPGKHGLGSVRRPDDFSKWASIIGSGTIPEVTEKMVNRDNKERNSAVGDEKSRLAERAVDALMSGSQEGFTEVSKKAMELGYTNFDKAITKAYENRYRTEAERSYGKGTTLQQYENYKYIKKATER